MKFQRIYSEDVFKIYSVLSESEELIYKEEGKPSKYKHSPGKILDMCLTNDDSVLTPCFDLKVEMKGGWRSVRLYLDTEIYGGNKLCFAEIGIRKLN